MHAFDYAAPANLSDALGLLREKGDRARVLSGGTDLIVQLREDKRQVDLVIDVKKIPELMELRFDPGRGLILGASVPCYKLYESGDLARAYPGLIDAAELIGGKQIQNRASFGGNLCNSSPAADSVPALIAHAAVCRIVGPEGTRDVPVENFCTGPGKNVLRASEMLVSFFIPVPPPRFGAHYIRFIPRNEMDIAVVGCGASVELSLDYKKFLHARIALGAVAPTPLLVESAGATLQNQEISEQSIEQAAAAAQAASRPITDMRGTAEYRRHLVGILTKRALRKAIQRAKEA